MSFHGPGEFMGPQLFFSVRHGLQQFQSLHDRGEESPSPVSGPDLQNSPSPVRHYFPNHGVEEKPKAFRPAFPIFLRQKTALHQVVEVQGKDGRGMKPLPFSLLPVVPFGEKEGRPIVPGRRGTGSRGRDSFCRGLYIPCHGIPLRIRLLRRCR